MSNTGMITTFDVPCVATGRIANWSINFTQDIVSVDMLMGIYTRSKLARFNLYQDGTFVNSYSTSLDTWLSSGDKYYNINSESAFNEIRFLGTETNQYARIDNIGFTPYSEPALEPDDVTSPFTAMSAGLALLAFARINRKN